MPIAEYSLTCVMNTASVVHFTYFHLEGCNTILRKPNLSPDASTTTLRFPDRNVIFKYLFSNEDTHTKFCLHTCKWDGTFTVNLIFPEKIVMVLEVIKILSQYFNSEFLPVHKSYSTWTQYFIGAI